MEAQQADAERPKRLGPPLSAAQAARGAQLETLRLARTRAAADLQRATATAHRAMLERAIADLDRQIAALGSD